jgi:hypothetical protein
MRLANTACCATAALIHSVALQALDLSAVAERVREESLILEGHLLNREQVHARCRTVH